MNCFAMAVLLSCIECPRSYVAMANHGDLITIFISHTLISILHGLLEVQTFAPWMIRSLHSAVYTLDQSSYQRLIRLDVY